MLNNSFIDRKCSPKNRCVSEEQNLVITVFKVLWTLIISIIASNVIMALSKLITLVIFLAVLLGPFVAVSTGQIEGPRYGGTFIPGIEGDPNTLNTNLSSSGPLLTSSTPIFNGLMRLDPNGNPVPDLAESWEISADGLTYTFHLVRNATWHDGVRFTSADVVYTWKGTTEGYMVMGKFASWIKPIVKSIEAPDDYTVLIKLKNPFAPFLTMASHAPASPVILPKHIYDGTDALKNPANLKPIGTGPFKFKEWQQGDHVTLVKNENYFKKGLPYLDQMIIRIIPDETARLIALQKGEVDYLNYLIVPYASVGNLKTMPGIISDPHGATAQSSTVYWMFNVLKRPFNDVRVRRAFAYAIDKQTLSQGGFFGFAPIAYSVLAPPIPFSNEGVVEKYSTGDKTRDVEIANSLLDQAGYSRNKDGIRFTATASFDRGRAYYGKMFEVAKDQLRKVGIELTLNPLDSAGVLDKVFFKWDFELAPQVMPSGPDPVAVTAFLRSTQHVPSANTNAMGYNNSRVDALFDKESMAMKRDDRAQYWAEIQKIVSEDVPVIPIVVMPLENFYSADFKDVIWGTDSFNRLGERTWWVKGTLPARTAVSIPSTVTTIPTATYTTAVTVGAAVAVIILMTAGTLWMRGKRKKGS